MRRISMAGADVAVTHDRIADLVLEYAMLLGRIRTTDTVTIPVADGGVPERASLLIGPASQIAVTPNDDLHLERMTLPGSEDAIADLQRRIEQVGGERHAAVRPEEEIADPAVAFPNFDDYRVDDDR